MTVKSLKFAVCLVILAGFVLPAFVFAAVPPPTPGFCPIQAGNTVGVISVPCPLGDTPGPAGQASFGLVVTKILTAALLIVGALSVFFLVWGGFRYVTAHDNEEFAEAAKNIIKNSIFGLIVVLMSFAIITIITKILVTGTP